MKKIAVSFFLLFLALSSGAQSRNFTIGKWTEVNNAILKELEKSYVDTLPLNRMERAGVDAILGSLDPYTVYVPEEENDNLRMMIRKTYGGIGAIIFKPKKEGNVIINEPYENSPAQKYGLSAGDEIMEIDGKSVVGLTSGECSEKMRGEPNTKVVFKVKKLRPDTVRVIEVVRDNIRIPDISYWGMLDAGTGYICQTQFTEGVAKDVRAAVIELKKQGMKKLILDLRGNGGGILGEAADIVSIFVPRNSLVVTAKGRGQDSNYTVRTRFEPVDTALPLAIMVDSSSASASEIVAGALQDLDRATIMGQRTFGKGLVQTIKELPYGGELKLTTAKYYTPSGRCVQAIDYSSRNEDGSVGHIPDSLTHVFKTSKGREVRDGGGITPDVIIPRRDYSRITYSVTAYGITEQYALEFVRNHESIPAVEDFHLSDEDYEAFVRYAAGQEFDYRSSARTYYDMMRKEMAKDGLEDGASGALDSLRKTLEMEKDAFLRMKKDEILPILEEEIVIRYYFQRAGEQLRIRYDDELKTAMTSPLAF